jgi:hypothetical protein
VEQAVGRALRLPQHRRSRYRHFVPSGPDQPPLPTSQRIQDERLSRLEAALAEGRAREEAWVEAWVRRTGELPSRKVRRKWEKKWRRDARREAQRAERDARLERTRNPVRGGIYVAVAVACVLMALSQPARLWWLVFVALSFFMSAAKHLERPRRDALRDAVEGPEAQARRLGEGEERSVRELELRRAEGAEPLRRDSGRSGERTSTREAEAGRRQDPGADASVDPRVAKVDALCGKLMEELRAGPAVLREVVHAPERTVEALRKGCHELVRRERELRALSTPEESRRLESEREALATRVSTEEDTVVRERLSGALAALDEQRRQRAELATAANRLEAEHTRLYYTLEGLYAQVLRVRSADTAGEDLAGAGLRQSVEKLGSEVEAVTQALEEVHRPPDGRVRTR